MAVLHFYWFGFKQKSKSVVKFSVNEATLIQTSQIVSLVD